MIHTIDAQGKKLGRVASEAASLLMGKNTTSFVRNAAPEVKVHVINTSKAKIDAKKKGEKIYKRYTGHNSGLKSQTMEQVIAEKGYSALFEEAIYGMLPHNKLTKGMMKNLVITE